MFRKFSPTSRRFLLRTERLGSVPFFFEPNFNAHVQPLAAALRLQGGQPTKEYLPVVYGEFLLKKVANNFERYEI